MKISAFIPAALLGAFLVGCSGGNEVPPNDGGTPPYQAPKPEGTTTAGEPAPDQSPSGPSNSGASTGTGSGTTSSLEPVTPGSAAIGGGVVTGGESVDGAGSGVGDVAKDRARAAAANSSAGSTDSGE